MMSISGRYAFSMKDTIKDPSDLNNLQVQRTEYRHYINVYF